MIMNDLANRNITVKVTYSIDLDTKRIWYIDGKFQGKNIHIISQFNYTSGGRTTTIESTLNEYLDHEEYIFGSTKLIIKQFMDFYKAFTTENLEINANYLIEEIDKEGTYIIYDDEGILLTNYITDITDVLKEFIVDEKIIVTKQEIVPFNIKPEVIRYEFANFTEKKEGTDVDG